MYEDNDAAVSGERSRQRAVLGAKVLKVVVKYGVKVIKRELTPHTCNARLSALGIDRLNAMCVR